MAAKRPREPEEGPLAEGPLAEGPLAEGPLADEGPLAEVVRFGAARAAGYAPNFTAFFSGKSLAVLRVACANVPKKSTVLMRAWDNMFHFLFLEATRHWRVSIRPTRLNAASSEVVAVNNEAFAESLDAPEVSGVTLTDADAHLHVNTSGNMQNVVTHLCKLNVPTDVPDSPTMENALSVQMTPADFNKLVSGAIGADITFSFDAEKRLVVSSKKESSTRDTHIKVRLADGVDPPKDRVTIQKSQLEPVEGLSKADSVNVLIHPDRMEFRGVFGDSTIAFLVASKISDDEALY